MHWLRGPHWKQRKIKKLEWKYKSNNDGLLGQGIKRGSRDKQIVHDSKSLHSCLTLYKPVDCGLPGSSVHVIIQARILECVAMPSSRGPSQSRDLTHVSYVFFIVRWDFITNANWEPQANSWRRVYIEEYNSIEMCYKVYVILHSLSKGKNK